MKKYVVEYLGSTMRYLYVEVVATEQQIIDLLNANPHIFVELDGRPVYELRGKLHKCSF